MRRLILAVIAALPALGLWGQAPKLEWKPVAKGVETCIIDTEYMGLHRYISAVRFNPRKHHLQLLSSPCEASDSTSALATKVGAIAAINPH